VVGGAESAQERVAVGIEEDVLGAKGGMGQAESAEAVDRGREMGDDQVRVRGGAVGQRAGGEEAEHDRRTAATIEDVEEPDHAVALRRLEQPGLSAQRGP
jgi:hypothetical protein